MDPNTIDPTVLNYLSIIAEQASAKDYSTLCYYTFSTIAQTLAVGFGLIFVGGFYILGRKENECMVWAMRILDPMRGHQPHFEKASAAIDERNWNSLLDYVVPDFLKSHSGSKELFEVPCKILSAMLIRKNCIIDELHILAYLTAISTILPLFLLIWVPLIVACSILVWIFLILAVLFSIVCIVSYTCFVISSLSGHTGKWLFFLRRILDAMKCKPKVEPPAPPDNGKSSASG